MCLHSFYEISGTMKSLTTKIERPWLKMVKKETCKMFFSHKKTNYFEIFSFSFHFICCFLRIVSNMELFRSLITKFKKLGYSLAQPVALKIQNKPN